MFDISKYEVMAKLSLPENERCLLSPRIEELIKSFDALEKIDTNNVQPLVSVLDVNNILREDISYKIFTRDEILANAPEQFDGYFQVPRTLD